MAEFTAKDVKALRDATGAGMMDAKKALTEADGDMEAAVQLLRERGLAKAADRSDRENNEGAIALAVDGNAAAIVQLRTETDFTAKSDGVAALVNELARFAHGLGVGRLIHADGAEAAALVTGHVGADPADFVGHVFIADAGGDLRGGGEFFLRAPAVGALDDVGFHRILF